MPNVNDTSRLRAGLLLVLICIILFSAYSNTFQSPPVLDDFHSFIHDPSVRKHHLSMDDVLSLSATKFGLSRWIPMVTFSWDIMIGQGDIFTFHVTNLLIHLLSFLGVLFLFCKLLVYVAESRQSSEALHQPLALAFWTAAIWALNPVQTNAVTYIVQRMASLATLFSVFSVAFYVSGRSEMMGKGGLQGKSIFYFLLSGLSLTLGLFSKENAAIVPLIIVVTEAWFFRLDLFRVLFRLARRHWTLSTIAILAGVGLFLHSWPGIISGYAGRHFTLGERLLTEARIVVWYISVVMWPSPSRLSLEHDVELSTSLFVPFSTFVSLLIIVVLLITSIRYRKRFPVTSYGVMWFFLSLLIESTIVPLELIFEHRMYLASIGLSLSVLVVAYSLLSSFAKRFKEDDLRKLSWSLFAIAAAVLSLETFERNSHWQDSVTLNHDNALKAPKNHRAQANYAVALSQAGRYEEAIEYAKMAIELSKPNFESYCEAVNTIVLSHHGLKDYETAVKEGERLLAEKPEHSGSMALPSSWIAIAYSYKDWAKLQEAYGAVLTGLQYEQRLTTRVPHLQDSSINLLNGLLEDARREPVDLDRDGSLDPGTLTNRAWIAERFLRLGEWAKARELLQESVADDKSDSASRKMLEALMTDDQKSRVQESKSNFKQKYWHDPFSGFNMRMAIAFFVREKKLPPLFARFGETLLDEALILRPDSPDAHLLKGWYHFERDELIDALREIDTALQLDGDYAKGWLGLGFFLAKSNRPTEAIAAFNKVLEIYPCYPHKLAIIDMVVSLHATSETLAKRDSASEH